MFRLYSFRTYSVQCTSIIGGNTSVDHVHLRGEGGQPRLGGVVAAEQPQLGAVVVGEVGAGEARRRHGGHHVPRLLRQRRRVRVEEEVVRRQELGEVHAVAGHHLHGDTVSVGHCLRDN